MRPEDSKDQRHDIWNTMLCSCIQSVSTSFANLVFKNFNKILRTLLLLNYVLVYAVIYGLTMEFLHSKLVKFVTKYLNIFLIQQATDFIMMASNFGARYS